VSHKIAPGLIFAAAFLAACGNDSTGNNPPPNLSCGQVTPTSLAPGEAHVFDPTAVTACVGVPSVPAAGSSGAEYLYLAAGTAGQEVSPAITAPYAIAGGSVGGATADQAPLPSPLVSAFKPQLTASQFHAMLRQRERAMSTDPNRIAFRVAKPQAAIAASTPIQVGDPKSFQVCRNSNCDPPFVTVNATAQHVGAKVVIYVDNTAPAPPLGYTTSELGNVGTLFDNFLHPIDVTNFGPETDIDGNGVVYVLLSPQVNRLSGNCNSSGSVILGFFFSADLEPGTQGSNAAEIFYSLVPDPTNTACTIRKNFALDILPPTFIHEFQHMISYGQHAVRRSGPSEDNWLNEGLSHYAEELGGRLIPDNQNPTVGPRSSGFLSPNSLTQFAFNDYDVSYKYLTNPETLALPQTDDGVASLQGGPNFLMVRWLGGQFGTTTPDASQFLVKATSFTLNLDNTNLVGAANVATQSGQPFDSLVVYWQLANYLDDLPGFAPTNPRLTYPDINLRSIFAQLHQADASTYPRVYPLVPDSTLTGAYQQAGTLRQATGHHVRIIQAPGAAGVNFLLTGQGGAAISSAIIPRIGLVRIR
jgi:hypothetical protein